MKYLIAGASGQLAKAFIERFERAGTDYASPPESDFDITKRDVVERIIQASSPDVLINCAAYNAVDGAESDRDGAFSVNATAVGHLADTAAKYGVRFVHYGSDYVFDGKTEHPYSETDRTAPLNVYGESKLAGEKATLESNAEALVLRVSWVYGNGSQNFFHKMLEWSETRDVLKIVWDQISVPTYTEDIVTHTLEALEKGLSGLYHLTNSGYASRYEVARHFFRCIGSNTTVLPIGTDAFPSPAKRPFFSAMSNRELSTALDSKIPTWEDAVKRFTSHQGFQA